MNKEIEFNFINANKMKQIVSLENRAFIRFCEAFNVGIITGFNNIYNIITDDDDGYIFTNHTFRIHISSLLIEKMEKNIEEFNQNKQALQIV